MKKLLLVALVGTSFTAFAADRGHGRGFGVVGVHGDKAMEMYNALNVEAVAHSSDKGTAEIKKVGTLLCGAVVKAGETETKYGCAMFGKKMRHPHRGPGDHGNGQGDDNGTGNGQGGDTGTGNGQGGDTGTGNGQGGDTGTGNGQGGDTGTGNGGDAGSLIESILAQ